MNEGDGIVEIKSGEGPEVYRLSRAFSVESLFPALERSLGSRIARVERDSLGGSHAVFFVTLEDGEERVLRIATHPEHDLALEIWVGERCRSLGLPVPETIACSLASEAGCPPFMVLRRMPGHPAHGQPLTPDERRVVLAQLGRAAAQIHSIGLAGFGTLVPEGDGYAGTSNSLAGFVTTDVERSLARLSDDDLSPERKSAVRERFAIACTVLDRPAGVMLHGDFRFKNILLNGLHVSAILDFEMAISGDPAMDLAWLLYSDGTEEEDLQAILKGYSEQRGSDLGPALRTRLLLYQLRYALEHLWWAANFHDASVTATVQRRIAGMLVEHASTI